MNGWEQVVGLDISWSKNKTSAAGALNGKALSNRKAAEADNIKVWMDVDGGIHVDKNTGSVISDDEIIAAIADDVAILHAEQGAPEMNTIQAADAIAEAIPAVKRARLSVGPAGVSRMRLFGLEFAIAQVGGEWKASGDRVTFATLAEAGQHVIANA